MSSNLPNGVFDDTYGAPWNDQSYLAEFRFEFFEKESKELSDICFASNLLTVSFVLTGPQNYDQYELEKYAKDAIHDEYPNLLANYTCRIIIEKIYEE